MQIVGNGGANTSTVTPATTTGNTPRNYTPTASAANIWSNSQADQSLSPRVTSFVALVVGFLALPALLLTTKYTVS